MVSVNPFDLENNDIIIRYAQDEFFSFFGYPRSSLPMKLDCLFGVGTLREAVFRLHRAIISRKSELRYINLYRRDGAHLTCHISLVSILSDSKPEELAGDPLYNRNERWAVLTIRSASVVGNSKFCGIGLLGTERVLPERLHDIGSRTEM